MKQKLLLCLLLLGSTLATAQTTAIPDPAFEQELINLNIDSDGEVNGQVLTSDVENVTELTIEVNYDLTDLTGIESFTALEDLTILHTAITELNVSQNINLKKLFSEGNMLTSLDVSNNTLLEELYLSNGDVGYWNSIAELDLSNCPNIRIIYASVIEELTTINLKNGNNNADMLIDVSMWIGDGPADPNLVANTVCIEVDDEAAAQANEFPYSEWTVYDYEAAHLFAENCALKASEFEKGTALSVYPNPASDAVYLAAKGTAIEKAELYDTSGRLVREYVDINEGTLSLTGIAAGTYILKAFTEDGILNAKVIVQ